LSDDTLPFSKTTDGVLVAIRLTPKASQNRILGFEIRDDGHVFLKAAVTAVPEKGKANRALLKLLSKTWGVGMRSLNLIRGEKDRYKTILVSDDTNQLLGQLTAWARTL
jgi:uncharacterized protein